MKKTLFLVLGILIIAGALFLKDNNIPFIQNNTNTEDKTSLQYFSKANQQNFISYTDSDYGFTAKYPIGFYAEQDDEISGAKVSFKAFLQDDLFEILRVDVVNETASKIDLDELSRESGMNFVSRKTTRNSFGQEFELFQFIATNPLKENAKLNVFQGIYNCQFKNNTYTANLMAAIPETLPQDNQMALYYLNEFKC